MRYVEACEFQEWHFRLSELAPDGEILPEKPYRYKCKSWRHAGTCRQCRGAIDFNRICDGITRRDDWCYLVLTYSRNEWPRWQDQYRWSYYYWSALRLRIRRKFKRCEYIQTWERHIEGGIHVNILLSCDGFREGCYEALKIPFKKERWFHDWLEKNAVDCGFGHVHWAQPMRAGTRDGMAGYMAKLAKELVGAGKKNQIPFDAPRNFRRIRCSRGILPKPEKSGMIGRLVMCQHPDDWDYVSDDQSDTNTA